MRIFEIMSEKPRTIPPTLPAVEAWRLMVAENVHHLIVKDGSKVVGVLSDSDAGGRHGAPVRSETTAADLMDSHFAAVTRQDTVRKAANLMRGRLIGCLPVIERDRLIGVVTVTDLLALLGRGVERPDHETRAALHHRVAHRKAIGSTGRW
jgi:acetoin utilization protein AcuB